MGMEKFERKDYLDGGGNRPSDVKPPAMTDRGSDSRNDQSLSDLKTPGGFDRDSLQADIGRRGAESADNKAGGEAKPLAESPVGAADLKTDTDKKDKD